MNRICVVGDTSIDHFLILDKNDAFLRINAKDKKSSICFNYSEKTSVETQEDFFGGSALNVAVSLANLNLQTHLYSIIGSDYEGREILGFLNSKKVVTDRIEVQGKTNQSFILVFEGDRTILSHHEKRNYSCLKAFDAEIIYLTSCGEGSTSLVGKIKEVVSKGSKLVFNPGNYEISSFGGFKTLLPHTNVLIINRLEARQIIEDTADVNKQLNKILDMGVQVGIITDGPNGAYFGTAQGNFYMPAVSAKVVDPTGAGDGFASALVAALVYSKSLEEAAKWGMINAVSIIESLGANSNPASLTQIDKEIQTNKLLKFSRV